MSPVALTVGGLAHNLECTSIVSQTPHNVSFCLYYLNENKMLCSLCSQRSQHTEAPMIISLLSLTDVSKLYPVWLDKAKLLSESFQQ